MPTTGRYLYGLIRTAKDRDFGCIGLEHEGKPARVYTARVDSVAAVVSEYGAREKVLPLRRNLDPHHRVIREVMKAATIAPMTRSSRRCAATATTSARSSTAWTARLRCPSR